MAVAGYKDTKEAIIDTLMGREVGHEIQPDEHQNFALKLLDYIRSVELISGSTLIGIAEPDTVPVQPDDAHVAYIAGVAQDRTVEYLYFIDQDGVPISITTGEMQAKFVIMLWNTEYWSYVELDTNIISHADTAYFFYNLLIRKTYNSVAAMNADKTAPVGDNGKLIKVGETVTVANQSNEAENAVYSYTGNGWRWQCSLASLSSRVFDGGRADTVYGGARNINCGGAAG